MQNEIIINADLGETRVAIVERSLFAELHIERDRDRGVVGNVVKGRVSRVLPGMQAAFVDIGLDKAAFLYAGDYIELNGKERPQARRGRRNNGRSNSPKIEGMLREGQEIVVQIAKEPIGTKGARITSNISIPGRHLVLTPWSNRVGVSRRIDSDKERRRLREIIERLRPRELGFIIRTAGDGVREADLEADIRYLSDVWEQIQAGEPKAAPCVLYSEPDLSLRVIRDFANAETTRIAIDSEAMHAKLQDFVERFVADPKPKIERYRKSEPIFDSFDLESSIQANLERKVWLKSGGYLIIDQSEALTSIDVNTGRYVGKRDLEETVFKTNLEAVKEVVHQLRFRNIGGIVIIDLIDMESSGNREKTYRALQDALRADKARTNILKISELGLVEMTRKRTRENLVQTLCEPCSYCEGRGYVLSRESVAFKVLREIRTDLPRFGGRQIAITVSPQVAEELLSSGKDVLRELSEQLGREIEIRARPGLHQEQFEVTALDQGEPVSIPLRWLGDRAGDEDEVSEPEVLEAQAQPAETESADEPKAEAATAADGAESEAETSAGAAKSQAMEEQTDESTSPQTESTESAELSADAKQADSAAEAPEAHESEAGSDAPGAEVSRSPEGNRAADLASATDEVASPHPARAPTKASAGGPPQTLDDGPESRILRPSQEHGDT